MYEILSMAEHSCSAPKVERTKVSGLIKLKIVARNGMEWYLEKSPTIVDTSTIHRMARKETRTRINRETLLKKKVARLDPSRRGLNFFLAYSQQSPPTQSRWSVTAKPACTPAIKHSSSAD